MGLTHLDADKSRVFRRISEETLRLLPNQSEILKYRADQPSLVRRGHGSPSQGDRHHPSYSSTGAFFDDDQFREVAPAIEFGQQCVRFFPLLPKVLDDFAVFLRR